MATHLEVAENWVKQTGKKRKGSNVYYDGNTIYSHGSHFPLATLYKGFALVNSNRYSVSSSRHKNIVWGALYNAGIPSIDCPFPNNDRCTGWHIINLEHLEGVMGSYLASAKRRRVKAYARDDLKAAKQAVEDHNKYIEWFGLDYNKLELPFEAAMIQIALEFAGH